MEEPKRVPRRTGTKIPLTAWRPSGSVPWLAILRACYRARKTPKPRKYEKNTKFLTPGWPPKIQKKYRKNKKTAQKMPFSGRFHIFSVFFLYFRGPTRGEEFCIFSYFRSLGVFGLCGRPARSQAMAVRRGNATNNKCCSCPGFHLRLGASDCSPGL